MKELIEKVLDQHARPYLHDHDGDVKITRIEGDTVYIQLIGQCAQCAYADLTIGELLTESIIGNVPGIHHVAAEPMDMDFYRHAKEFVAKLKTESGQEAFSP